MSKTARRRPPEAFPDDAPESVPSNAEALAAVPDSLRACASGTQSSLARTLARIDMAEDLMSHRYRDRRVARILAHEWGVSLSRGMHFVKAVRERWAKDGKAHREERTAELRARARHTFRTALEHRKPVTVGVGIGLSKVELWHEPNEAAALKALQFEAQLDGLLEPDKVDITMGGSVDVRVQAAMQRAYGLGPLVIEGEGEPLALPSNGHSNGKNGKGNGHHES